MTMEWLPTELLWRSALAVIPLAMIVAALCRWAPCRPSTRHSLWVVVLGVLLAAPFLPRLWLPPSPAPPAEPLTRLSSRNDPGLAAGAFDRSSLALHERLPAPDAGRGMMPVTERTRRDHGRESDGSLRTVAPSPRSFSAAPAENAGPLPRPRRSPATRAKPARPAIVEMPQAPVPADSLARTTPAPVFPLGSPPKRAPGVDAAKPIETPGGPGSDPTPARAAGLPSEPPAPARQWKQWVVQLAVIRDAVLGLPPLPASVWVGGLVVLLLWAAGRISRSLRVIRAAQPAPASVVRQVAAAARHLGLRRAPLTVMVEKPISPMLWCGWRACLILPRRLWAQLDPVGRRAVVYHELAHLRRRDHWVCWVEMFVGWIYWWHPVVWWVRRRLREEADLSCDVWVTALLPGGRRAYAQALLETRRYSSVIPHPRLAVPSVGLGASTVRARRFARRITMVMTAQMRPGLSLKGIALACVLALGGYLASPMWACPPADKDDCKPSKTAKAPKPPKPAKPFKIAVPAPPPKPEAAPGDAETTFERFMLQGERPHRENMSLEERIEELERQLDRLHEQLERLLGRPRGVGMSGGHFSPGPVEVPTLSELKVLPSLPVLGMAQVRSAGTVEAKDALHNCLRKAALATGPTVARSYRLPEGKLKALTELMVRSDVPILVRPSEDRIEVQATERQHCVFEAFCKLIDAKDQVMAYRLPEGKLEALSEFMIRSDVPILVEPGPGEIKVHGTDLEQAVFDAFVTMIHPPAATEATAEGRAQKAYQRAFGNLAGQYESKAASQMLEHRSLQAALRSLQSQVRAFEREADRMNDRAERLQDKAEDLVEEADDLTDEADDLGGRRRSEMLAKAEFLKQQAAALRDEARVLEEQAEAVQEQADKLEDEAREIEHRIDDLEEEADDDEDDD
jgi:beta-lactamase regulating signal transducer with metallopeptidase domain/phage shock protein A